MKAGNRMALVAAVAVLAGCATTESLTGLNRTGLSRAPPACRQDFEFVFSGTRLEGCTIAFAHRNLGHPDATLYFLAGVTDAPFSFVADTVLLPVTLTLEALD